MVMNRYLAAIILCLWCFLCGAKEVAAADLPFGFHLFDPAELELVSPFKDKMEVRFVTVPMALADRRKEVWNNFFRQADQLGITPIIRLVTVFADGNWQVPSRKELVEGVKFMNSLDWSGRRIVVLFNEPNHAAEWGGKVDPEGYADVALFAANWLKTEKPDYLVLPAGLDADAPSNSIMMESSLFIDRMYRSNPELFEMIDGWTSHSYPNPAFSSSVYAKGKNSIRGFEYEWEKLRRLTGREFDIYITETGWKLNRITASTMARNYREAILKIWPDERIKAVTVFVLKGVEGPFEEFSLLDEDNKPTGLMKAIQAAFDRK